MSIHRRHAENTTGETTRQRVLKRWWWLQVPLVGFVVAQLYASPQIDRNVRLAASIEAEESARLAEALKAKEEARKRLDGMVQEALEPALTALARVEAIRDSLLAEERRARAELDAKRGDVERLEKAWVAAGEREEDESHAAREARRVISDREFQLSLVKKALEAAANEERDLRGRIYRLEHPEEFEQRALVSPEEGR